MALYAIADLHLSFGADKPMDVFGPLWKDYANRLREGLSILTPEDTTVFIGDLSWAMDISEAREDFEFIAALAGRKIIVKGNHDYWWTTASKFQRFCQDNDFEQMHILHNNCYFYGELALCGTRGWFFEENKHAEHDEKVFKRELQRLQTSLEAAGDREKICFLHYPPVYRGYCCKPIVELMKAYGVKQCIYGHLHSDSHKLAITGEYDGINYSLAAADYTGFRPILLKSE